VKLSDYANKLGVSYKTVWRYWKAGKLNGFQTATGTVIVTETLESSSFETKKAAIYARVSSSENKTNLEAQAGRLQEYAIAKGYQIQTVIQEVGSGVNDQRPKLLKALTDNNYNVLLVEHKDRLARFGVSYIELMLKQSGKELEIVNLCLNDKEDLLQDFVSVITSFCARLDGQRRSKRKTEKLIKELANDEK
jgi:predicted site-specific integrase-resolvase